MLVDFGFHGILGCLIGYERKKGEISAHRLVTDIVHYGCGRGFATTHPSDTFLPIFEVV